MWENLHCAALCKHRAWENLWEDTMSAVEVTRPLEVLITLAPATVKYIFYCFREMCISLFVQIQIKAQLTKSIIHSNCNCITVII